MKKTNHDGEYSSDEEVNKKQHARLLSEVLQLDKKQNVKKPSRTEPATHVSEFTLVKPSKGRRTTVALGDLTKSLIKKSKYEGISRKIKNAHKTEKTLPKPLEKPQAERIRRTVGFENTKFELGKWNSVVMKNRVSAHLTFPLNQDLTTIKDKAKEKIVFPLRYKSELDRELEKLEPQETVAEMEEKFPLTLEELKQHRHEMAKLRAHQSFKEAKAHRKKKIKSKKYHKIERKAKIKQQIKEFEELKKINPEEALRKLEELEKTRAEERMSLRHRSTGQWAKNKQVRAKYNKESRQALAQQLSLSRELTQKLQATDSTDSEPDDELEPKRPRDESNPWILDKSAEVNEFISGYRKYWNEKNKNGLVNSSNHQNNTNISLEKEKPEQNVKNYISVAPDKSSPKKSSKNIHCVSCEEPPLDVATKNLTSKSQYEKVNSVSSKSSEIVVKKAQKKGKGKSSKESFCSSTWLVTSAGRNPDGASAETELEDMFEDLEHTVKNKAEEKLAKLKAASQTGRKRKLAKKERKPEVEGPKSNLEFPRERMRPEIDEELGFSDDDERVPNVQDDDKTSGVEKSVLNGEKSPVKDLKSKDSAVNIDPNKYMSVKPVNWESQLPDISMGDDSDGEDDQRQFIAEAFADDDIVTEFSKEKEDIIEQNKPKDIDLTLPGWGSWAGKNIDPTKRKQKRLILKAPKEKPRKDLNKGNLILNEQKDSNFRKHQVSELPFPFTKVKDFEASIRAPIGDTFVPQTAFRKNILPTLVTKKGAVIEPMTEDILLNQKFSKNGLLVHT